MSVELKSMKHVGSDHGKDNLAYDNGEPVGNKGGLGQMNGKEDIDPSVGYF
jgi:hypothetical protein